MPFKNWAEGQVFHFALLTDVTEYQWGRILPFAFFRLKWGGTYRLIENNP